MRHAKRALFVMIFAAAAGTAQAENVGPASGLPVPRFVSLKADKVNMHIGPAKTYEVKWVYQRAGLPVEITAEFENWRRIRDADGAEGWVYHSLLSGRRTGLVIAKAKDVLVPLYEKADVESAVVAKLEPGVLGHGQALPGRLVPDRRPRLRRLDPAGPAVGRLPEREGRVRRVSRYCVPDANLWRHTHKIKQPGDRPGRRNQRISSSLFALAAQPHHHVDAGDLVAGRRDRHLADDLVGAGNVDQRVVAFDEEMMMRRGVGVEIGLRAVDRDLAQQARPR